MITINLRSLVLLQLVSLGIVFTIPVFAQLSYTGFEGLADEAVFTRNTGAASWVGQGFIVPWVNGFDQNRAYIDDAYAKTGTKSLRIFYPVNNYGPPNSGAQAPLMVTPASQYYMSYWVRFSDNFSWGNTSEGGKLPGLGGGGRCSGCAVCTGSNGFTARLMWRTGGRLVLYLYHMEADKINPPCGDNRTLQIGGTDYYAPKGQWIHIIERVKVNTGTNHDGEVELWINEQQALLVTGIQFVSNGDQVDNLYFSTFHGGSTAGWSPTVDSYTWFDDIKISINPADIFTPLSIQEEVFESNDEKKEGVVLLHPQPVKTGEYLTLKLPSEYTESYKMDLFTSSGRLFNSLEAISGKEIKIPQDMLPGIYMLRIRLPDRVLLRKIVVE